MWSCYVNTRCYHILWVHMAGLIVSVLSLQTMAKSLKELLTYQGNVQDDFCYTFQVLIAILIIILIELCLMAGIL